MSCKDAPDTARAPLDGDTTTGYPVRFTRPATTRFPTYNNPNGSPTGNDGVATVETFTLRANKRRGRRIV